MARVDVKKTYKLYIGGKFPRSESGRSYEVYAARKGEFLANAAQGSRKDARDAVVARARRSPRGPAPRHTTAVKFSIASPRSWRARRPQFVAGGPRRRGAHRCSGGIRCLAGDRPLGLVCRVVRQVCPDPRRAQPGRRPLFNISGSEPTGVVAVLAPQESSLLGLVSVIAPVIVSGNAVVVVTSADRPLPAITLAECLATSDVPGGVVNIITGKASEIAPWLASHRDVNAIDLAGAAGADGVDWGALEEASAENLKRVLRPRAPAPTRSSPTGPAPPTCPGSRAFLETKTVWHPKGR